MSNDGMERWAHLYDQRGHAGGFARKTSDERALVERQTVEEWRRSLEAQSGLLVTPVVQCEADPPDFIGQCLGRAITIELVERVDSELLSELAGASRQGRLDETRAQSFDRAQWTSERFVHEIGSVLDKKHAKYGPAGLRVDILVIHTAEPWLRARFVRDWLRSAKFEPRGSIGNAHLLLTYDPNEGEHWPLFEIYASQKDSEKLCLGTLTSGQPR